MPSLDKSSEYSHTCTRVPPLSSLSVHPWNEEVLTSSTHCSWKRAEIFSRHVSHFLSIFNPAQQKVKKRAEKSDGSLLPSLLCWCRSHLEFALNNHFYRRILKQWALSLCLLFVLAVFLALVPPVFSVPASLSRHFSLLSHLSSLCFAFLRQRLLLFNL